jgi:hypothetical protein
LSAFHEGALLINVRNQMNTYIFPLWLLGKETVCIDAKVFADSQQDAVESLWRDGVSKVWVIGDCRYCCIGISE